MIFKVNDNGWFDGVTFVEVNNETILWGDYYWAFDKKGKPLSIELCDSEDLSQYVCGRRKMYKKIIKASQEIHKGSYWCNDNVVIDFELKK